MRFRLRTKTKKKICEWLCCCGLFLAVISCGGFSIGGMLIGTLLFICAGWKAGLFCG